jgi:hypothetical protein
MAVTNYIRSNLDYLDSLGPSASTQPTPVQQTNNIAATFDSIIATVTGANAEGLSASSITKPVAPTACCSGTSILFLLAFVAIAIFAFTKMRG